MINYLKRDLRKCWELPVIIQPNHDVINKESLNLYHVILGNYDYPVLWHIRQQRCGRSNNIVCVNVEILKIRKWQSVNRWHAARLQYLHARYCSLVLSHRNEIWGLIQYKIPSYQYRKSHCGDEAILRPFFLHNRVSYTGKIACLYWIRTQDVNPYIAYHKLLHLIILYKSCSDCSLFIFRDAGHATD